MLVDECWHSVNVTVMSCDGCVFRYWHTGRTHVTRRAHTCHNRRACPSYFAECACCLHSIRPTDGTQENSNDDGTSIHVKSVTDYSVKIKFAHLANAAGMSGDIRLIVFAHITLISGVRQDLMIFDGLSLGYCPADVDL